MCVSSIGQAGKVNFEPWMVNLESLTDYIVLSIGYFIGPHMGNQVETDLTTGSYRISCACVSFWGDGTIQGYGVLIIGSLTAAF